MSGHHFVPGATYFKVLMALLVLTVITVAVAKPVSGFDVGLFNTFLAMAIATLKAGLVLSIFMQLKYDDKFFLVIILTGVFFLIIMFALSYLDIISRIEQGSTL